MNTTDITRIEDFLKRYYQEFFCQVESRTDIQTNLRMKYSHALAVHALTKELAVGLHLDHETTILVQAAALLHDVGRFSQIVEYQGYSDTRSIDHAALGLAIIRERGVLAYASADDVAAIEISVREHNKRNLSAEVNGHGKIVAQVLRDADKIDIVQVSTEFYASETEGVRTGLFCEMSFAPVCNEVVVKALLAGEAVPICELATVYDEFLLYLSWVNDLHFDYSVKYLAEIGRMDYMISVLPDTAFRCRVAEYVHRRVDERCALYR